MSGTPGMNLPLSDWRWSLAFFILFGLAFATGIWWDGSRRQRRRGDRRRT
jgi:hypothetical protein